MAGSSAKKRHEANQKYLKAVLAGCAIVSMLFVGFNDMTFGMLSYYAFVAGPMWISLFVIRSSIKASYDEEGKVVDCGDFLSRVGPIEFAKDCVWLSWIAVSLCAFSNWGLLFYAAIPVVGGYGVYSCFIKPLKDMQSRMQAAAGAPIVSEKKQRKQDLKEKRMAMMMRR
eukprot:ANDGO_05381.mRNA.1 Transmembrane protein 208 homolog